AVAPAFRAGGGRQYGGGGGDPRGGRPVVGVEPENRRTGDESGQTVEQGGIGAVPAVDGLAGVAHHEEVGPVPEPPIEDPPLGPVHILELVDEEVPDPPAGGGSHRAVGFEEIGAAGQEVVQVDHPVGPL